MDESITFDLNDDGDVVDTTGVEILSDKNGDLQITFFDESISIDELDLDEVISISESELSSISRDIEELIVIEFDTQESLASRISQIADKIENLKKLLLQVPNLPERIRKKIKALLAKLEAELRKTSEEKELTLTPIRRQSVNQAPTPITHQTTSSSEMIKIDLEPEEVREITTRGIENPSFYKHKYKIIIDASTLEKIIFHSKTEALGGETGGVLVGNFDRENNRILVNDYLPLPEGVNRSSTHVQFFPDSWTKLLTQLDELNRQNPYNQKDMLGWFHTHPNLGAFLSSADDVVHSTFVREDHIAIVYDPIREQFLTWQDISHLSPQEREEFRKLGSIPDLNNRYTNKTRTLGVTPSIQIIGTPSPYLKNIIRKLKVTRQQV